MYSPDRRFIYCSAHTKSTFFLGMAEASASRQYSKIFWVGFRFLFLPRTGAFPVNQMSHKITQNVKWTFHVASLNQHKGKRWVRKFIFWLGSWLIIRRFVFLQPLCMILNSFEPISWWKGFFVLSPGEYRLYSLKMYCSGVHIPSDIYCTDAYPENLNFPDSLFKLQSICKERQTNTVLPVSLTRASDSKGSASGGGVSVSMERTGASWGDVFSVLGICSSEGVVAAISSGGGVCISGSKFKDGWSCVSLTDPGGSDTGVMGWVTWENKLCQFTANLKYKVSKSDTECSMP